MLELHDIRKSFGTVEVLHGLELSFARSQVQGLVGENGAGKSTLLNVIGGQFPPSTGEMTLDGQPYHPRTPDEAAAAGVRIIHQELNLFPNLSVTENLLLGHLPTRNFAGFRLLDRKTLHQRTAALLQRVGLHDDVGPATPLSHLSPAQRQLVEIAKALSGEPRLLLFDEPTTALSRHESERLFELIRELRDAGTAIAYVSHKLADVTALADDIAVLRDGHLVGSYPATEGYDIDRIVHDMVGRELQSFFPPPPPERLAAEPLLEVTDLAAGRFVSGMSFRVGRGEIVGMYGLIGAGRTETARLVYGLEPSGAGTIRWKGEPIDSPRPRDWPARGLAFLTEDRGGEGLLLDKSVTTNAGLVGLKRRAAGLLAPVRQNELIRRSRSVAKSVRVRAANLNDQPVGTLSGGNQQKVVLAKWLLDDPELLILDEPTKGIDVGARYDIYQLIREATGRGAGVWLISSEVEELLGLCDRILVVRAGRVVGEFTAGAFDREAMLSLAVQ